MLQPEFKKYGAEGYKKALQDTRYHLQFFLNAYEKDSFALFDSYMKWCYALFHRINLPSNTLSTSFQVMRDTLLEYTEEESEKEQIMYFINNALDKLSHYHEPESFIKKENPYYEILSDYSKLVLENQKREASKLILDMVKSGTDIGKIYYHVFQPFQYEIGRLWQTNNITVAQEHYATAVTQLIMSQLYEYIFAGSKKPYTFVGTCIEGELHELGMRMITDYIETQGWSTYYLGANTPIEDIPKTLIDKHADVAGISVTMLFNIEKAEELISLIRKEMGNSIKVLVGGYPFSIDSELSRKIGADAHSKDITTIEQTIHEILKVNK